MNYAQLEALLQRRLTVISDATMRERNPEEQLKLLKEVSEGIDSWREGHVEEMPFHLRHFLENYSLDKALAFVQSEGEQKRC